VKPFLVGSAFGYSIESKKDSATLLFLENSIVVDWVK